MSHKQKLFILTGPTASGKTEVACEIASLLPVEVISFDSMQVYSGMPVMTQAPSKKQMKILRAHLVSCVSPSREYNAALFRKQAMALIPQIFKRGRIPLLVGGTGLYLRALLDGLFESGNKPSNSTAYRQKLTAEEKKHGAGFLYGKLKKVDAGSAAKIHPNDIRRLIRALEVFHLTKKPMSEQKPNRKGIRGDFESRILFLNRDRQDLYARAEQRVHTMMVQGLMAEVKRLSKKKLSKTAAMALGFREIKSYLDGKITRAEALELLKKNTRHYAKRQVSWFRHEKEVCFVDVSARQSAQDIAEKLVKLYQSA